MYSRFNRRRRRSLRLWRALGILAVAVYVIVQFVIFQMSLARLPASWTIGGAAFPNQTIDDAVAQLDDRLQQPITLRYLTSTVTLAPHAVDFTLDLTETRRLAHEERARSASLTDLLRQLVWQPPAPHDVPVVASYSDEKARTFLAGVADRLDVAPGMPAPQIDAMKLSPGQPGHLLNIVESMPPLESALKSAVQRTADLVVDSAPAPAPTLNELAQLIQTRLVRFPGTASVFLKDLQTGQELNVNPNIPFSGGGVMKLPIVAEVFRKYDLPLDITTTHRLTSTLATELSNLPANQLLNQIGDGNTAAGVDTVSASLAHLGLRNSYLAQPYDLPLTATAGITTPANLNPPFNTNPSPAVQTTASDMGLLWEMIYQCGKSGGALLVVYPDQFNPLKCQQIVELIQDHAPADVPELLRGGVPKDAQIAQRAGGSFDTRGAAGLVRSPGGDYVLVVFLNTANQNLDWAVTDSIMKDLSRAAYNYFNTTQ